MKTLSVFILKGFFMANCFQKIPNVASRIAEEIEFPFAGRVSFP
jgi:hypothetical protein